MVQFLEGKASRPALGTTQWVPGAIPPGSEANDSPPLNVDVKKMWSDTFTHWHGAKLNIEATLLLINVRKCLSFTRLIYV